MVNIVVPKDLQAQFLSQTKRFTLSDERGTVIGIVTPTHVGTPEQRASCPYTDEQLKGFLNSGDHRTLKEVMAELEKLT